MLKRVANPSELYFANTDFKKQRKGSDFNGWVGNKTVFPEKKTLPMI
jgi:hypothetical protein